MRALVTALLTISFCWSSTVQAQPVKELDISPESIEGDVLKPGEENIRPLSKSKSSSLIRVRTDFVVELIKSVDDI